jgi:hypothetical protein
VENQTRAKTKVGDDIVWQAPVKLAAPTERQSRVTGAINAMGDAGEERKFNSADAVIEVRRVVEKSTSSGVWKWFIATFIVVGVLVWLAMRSGASA